MWRKKLVCKNADLLNKPDKNGKCLNGFYLSKMYRRYNICKCGNITKEKKCTCGNEEWEEIPAGYPSKRTLIKRINDFKMTLGMSNEYVVSAKCIELVMSEDTADLSLEINEKVFLTLDKQMHILIHNLNEILEAAKFLIENLKGGTRIKTLEETLIIYKCYSKKNYYFDTNRMVETYNSIYQRDLKNFFTEDNYKKYPLVLMRFMSETTCEDFDDFLQKRQFPLQLKNSLIMHQQDFDYQSIFNGEFLSEENLSAVSKYNKKLIDALNYYFTCNNLDVDAIRNLIDWINKNKDINQNEIAKFLFQHSFFNNQKIYHFLSDLRNSINKSSKYKKFIEELNDVDENRVTAFFDFIDVNPFLAIKLLASKGNLTKKEISMIDSLDASTKYFSENFSEGFKKKINYSSISQLSDGNEEIANIFYDYYKNLRKINDSGSVDTYTFNIFLAVLCNIKMKLKDVDIIDILTYLIKDSFTNSGHDKLVIPISNAYDLQEYGEFYIQSKFLRDAIKSGTIKMFPENLSYTKKLCRYYFQNPDFKQVQGFDEKVPEFKKLEKENEKYAIVAPESKQDLLIKSLLMNFNVMLYINLVILDDKKIMFLKDKAANEFVAMLIYDENQNLVEHICLSDNVLEGIIFAH